MQSSRRLHFNPLALAADQEAIFYSLVRECAKTHGVTYFEPGKIYSADVEFQIAGNHPFLFREKLCVPSQFRLDVIGEKINDGAFGQVYHIIATLKPFNKQASNAKRVVKVFNNINSAAAEYEVSQFIPHLRLKMPVSYCVSGAPLRAHVMRCFAGVELFEKKDQLTDDELLITARNVLFAVKEQAHDIGIIHQDVKAENMIVDDSLRVTLIDYGASHRQEIRKKVIAGSYVTMAPEVARFKGATIKSDVFSVGITLAEIFGADSGDDKLVQSKRDLSIKFNNLFKSNPGISAKHRKSITKMLLKMCRIDPEARCSLQDGIDVLESIILERKQEKLHSRTQKNAYLCVHEKALLSRKLLHASGLRAGNRLEALNLSIQCDMVLLNPSPVELEHYLFMLRVESLRAVRDKDTLLKTVEDIVGRYHVCIMNINALYAEYGRLLTILPPSSDYLAEAHEYYQDATCFMQHKLPECEKTIDGCISLVSKLEKRYQPMKVRVEYLQSQIPQPNAGISAMSI